MFPFEEELRTAVEESPFSEEFAVERDGLQTEPVEFITLTGDRLVTLEGVHYITLDSNSFPPVGLLIKGIFDEAVENDQQGQATRLKPRIITYRFPVYRKGVTRVMVRGKVYRVAKHDVDANNGVVVWLL